MQGKAEEYMLPCLNKKLLGVECPGCGMQRATVLVSKGEFQKAFTTFPPVYTTLLFLLAAVVHLWIRKKKSARVLLILAVINGLFVAIAYIVKMTKQ